MSKERSHHHRGAPRENQTSSPPKDIASSDLDDQYSLSPPTDPGDQYSLSPPTDPGDQYSLSPPTDPGDQYSLNSQSTNSSNQDYRLLLVPPTEPNLLFNHSQTSPEISAVTSKPSGEEVAQIFSKKSLLVLAHFLKGKWGTFSLFSSILVTYYLTTYSVSHSIVTLAEAISWGANFAPKTNGQFQEWWRLLTAPFLHWDSAHLTFNLGAFLLLSLHIEHLVGTIAILGLFFTSATLAGIATLIAYPAQVSMGASGGIYGFFGAIITLFILTRGKRITDTKLTTSAMILWLIYSLTTNINSPWVDNASHFGGMLSGFVLGIFYAPLYRHQRLSLLTKLSYNILPILFTIVTITLSWSFLPTPHPIFELLEQYSRESDHLRLHVDKFANLTPLNQRAMWETEIKPSLMNLEHKFKESAQISSVIERNEIKDVTQATQWALKRLLNGWWIYFGEKFEPPPSDLNIEHDIGLPFNVAHGLYESLFSKQAISQLIDPTWDERITALETYHKWSYLEGSRLLVSDICAHLVGEASSPQVRERGSLWGQPEVRESRFKLVEHILDNMAYLTSKDYVTLHQIKWLRGDVNEVTSSSVATLTLNLEGKLSLNAEDRLALAKLLYRALLSASFPQVDPSINFKLLSPKELSLTSGTLPYQGRLYVLAQHCNQSNTQPKGQQSDPTPERLLIEVRVPKLSETQTTSTIKLAKMTKQSPKVTCLEHFKTVGWMSFKESPAYPLSWVAHPLDYIQP